MMRAKKVDGCEIPAIGLGTYLMRGRSCVESVKSALEFGYRHLDTARSYGNEREVGEGIRKSRVERGDVFVTTKIWRTDLERSQVIRGTRRSLDALQTSYIDLLLIHWPNSSVPIEETLRAFEDLKEKGKVKHIGVSNFTIPLLEEALNCSDLVCNQVECHPLLRQERMLNYCQENDLILMAYRPFGKGKLFGNEVIQEIAEKYGKSEAQVILRWLIQQDNIVAIPKASSHDHQKDNLKALDWNLEEGDFEALSSIEEQRRFCNQPFAPWK